MFGLGYGGVFSVGWALALDAIPELGDVARDLGMWGTLSNLPIVVAPTLGAVIIAHGATPGDGYRWLFATASASFLLGSLTVLAGRTAHARHDAWAARCWSRSARAASRTSACAKCASGSGAACRSTAARRS